MAKKRTTSAKQSAQPDKAAGNSSRASGPFEQLGRRIDKLPQAQALEEALIAFQDEIEQARQRLDQLRRALNKTARQTVARAVEPDDPYDEADLFDHTMQYIRRNPFRSILAALLTGLFLGRVSRH